MLRLFVFMATLKEAILADSPQRYYKLDSTAGTDEMGVSNLTLSGLSTTTSNYTAMGGGLNSTGTGTASFTMPTITTAASFEAWVKTSAPGGGSHTIFRADGTDVAVIRVQGATNGTNPGKILCLFGGTPLFYSTSTVNDNAWHHVVVTLAGTTAKLYVDGSLQTTATTDKSSYSFGTGYLFRPTDGTSTEFLTGALDEVAIYNTTLTSTQISTHYNAAANANGGYTAQAATGSGAAVDPVTTAGKVYSTNFSDGVTHVTDALGRASVTGGHLVISNTASDGARYIPIADTFQGSGEVVLRVSALSGLPNGISPFVAADASGTGALKESGPSYSLTAGKWMRVRRNVSTQALEYKVWSNGSAEPASFTSIGGSVLSRPYSGIWFNTTGAYSVTIDLMYVNTADAVTATLGVIDNSYSATPATGSGLMASATFSNTTNVNHVATPATGSGTFVDPAISVVSNISVAASPFTGDGVGPQGFFSVPGNVNASPALGDGLAVDPAITTDRNAIILAAVATGEGYLEAPLEARASENDPYYLEILNTTDSDDRWYRLDEISGSTVAASTGGTGAPKVVYDGTLFGDWSFNVFGPEGRRAIHFNQGYFEQIQTSLVNEFTFEAVIRTTTKDGMLAYGLDSSPVSSGVSRNSIYLKNGKVTIDFVREGIISGIKDVADGKWHHIVVSWGLGSSRVLDTGFRVYIDGKLDFRREQQGIVGTLNVATPDWFFGVPTAYRMPQHPANFVGDVMEVIFRTNSDLDEAEAQRLFYAAMGIFPIHAEPMLGSGVAGDAKGKGNQKRALVLYFGFNQITTGTPDTTENALGFSDVLHGDFDFGPLIPTPGMIGYQEKLQAAGYRVFYKDVILNGFVNYRDYVTDLPRLLNLQTDLDMEQFDLVMYRNWPNEGREIDKILSRGFTNQDIEDHLASLRQAVDDGVSLWVSDPALANRLGIVSRVEYLSTLTEHKFVPNQGGNQIGNFDDHSDAIDPWAILPAIAYRDTHRNNRERVVANIEGMTDIPSHIITDAMHWDPYNIGGYANQYALKYEARPSGLQIGDDYIEPTIWWNDLTRDEYFSVSGDEQYVENLYAVPPEAVLAGTPVTKLGQFTWQEGNVQVPNPYADYVGTIVIQPGDNLNGRPVGGKILFTISEDPRWALFDGFGEWRKQIVPPNEEIANPEFWEGADKREWDYTMNRIIFGSTTGGGGQNLVAVQNPDGSISYEVQSSTKLSGVNMVERWPTVTVKVLSMIQRGLAWLAERVTTAPGDKNIRPSAITGSGVMVNPVVVAQKSTTVNVQAGVGTGQMVSPDEAADPDVTVLVLPATGSGEMTNYEKKIVVAPFEGSGIMTEIEEVTAQRDTLVLYLLQPTQITLYKEDN